MLAKSGKKYVEAEFNNAMIQENIGRTNTAINLYKELIDYLKNEKPVQSNWIFKTYVYLGAARERKGNQDNALSDFQLAESYVTTPAERNSISTHLARMNEKLN